MKFSFFINVSLLVVGILVISNYIFGLNFLKRKKRVRFNLPHWLGPATKKPPEPPARWGYCNGGCK